MRTYSLELIADAADGNLEDIRPDGYSGRGMYGKTCASVTFPNAQAIYQFFTQLGYYSATGDASRGLSDLVNASRTDSMGLDTVVYFPGWTFV